MAKQKAPEGYGFCPVCGGLFDTDAQNRLPAHIWTGRGNLPCPGEGQAAKKEGEISP